MFTYNCVSIIGFVDVTAPSIQFALAINGITYKEDLKNKSSPLYIEYATNITETVSSAFSDVLLYNKH
jgi:hypothetical protein